MVPHKGVERTQLHPSDAQFLCSVKQEAAYIGAHERNAKYLEIHHHCWAVEGGVWEVIGGVVEQGSCGGLVEGDGVPWWCDGCVVELRCCVVGVEGCSWV